MCPSLTVCLQSLNYSPPEDNVAMKMVTPDTMIN